MTQEARAARFLRPGERPIPTIRFPFPLGKGLGVRFLASFTNARTVSLCVTLTTGSLSMAGRGLPDSSAVWLTNAFGKKFENHCHMVALYAVWYNLIRIHKTLRVTPRNGIGHRRSSILVRGFGRNRG